MYTRNVSIQLKPNTGGEFRQMFEKDILPLMRKQKGFKDGITFLGADGKDAVAISFWDRKESADAYSQDGYPQVLKGLAKVIDGTPEVHVYEVANSTLHKIAAHN